MSDDIKVQLRKAFEWSNDPMLEQAQDRIEKLEAKLVLSEGALDVASRSWGESQRILEQTEDKLEKAIGALEKVQTFVRDLEPHADHGHTLVPALREACEILAELKGETDGCQ